MRLFAFLLCLTVFYQSKGIEQSYDKVRNQTIAATEPIEIKLDDEFVTKNFTLKIQCSVDGAIMFRRPENAHLVFRALSHRWRFLEESEREAILIVDDVIFRPSTKPQYTSVIGEKFLDETLTYEVKMSDVEKMADKSKIDVKIGGVSGKLREKQLSKIKEFLDTLPRT
jgi:hypothetical protein